jgi:hypothetical protein
MENRINRLEIENFKSIKKLQLDCKRVNIFIGKPNVGKSNILEALSLLGAAYAQDDKKFLSDFIRYENFSNIFYDEQLEDFVSVESDLGAAYLFHESGNANYYTLVVSEQIDFFPNKEGQENFLNYLNGVIVKVLSSDQILSLRNNKSFFINGKRMGTGALIINKDAKASLYENHNVALNRGSNIKKYEFNKTQQYDNFFPFYLMPPFGNNLFSVISNNKSFRVEVSEMFKEYGLDMVYRTKDRIFEIQKNVKDFIYSYPYYTVADTLKRVIFYLTAIESNKDSVLIFEEPEANTFPPYVRTLAQRIANDECNQYFIPTQSPYLLKTLIENTPIPDLNVSVVYYEDYQTKVHSLSEEHIRDILFKKEWDEDVFFNLDQLRNYGKQGSEVSW